MKQNPWNLQRMTAVAMLAALSYVVFTFLQIKISLPGGDARPSTWATPSASWARC